MMCIQVTRPTQHDDERSLVKACRVDILQGKRAGREREEGDWRVEVDDDLNERDERRRESIAPPKR